MNNAKLGIMHNPQSKKLWKIFMNSQKYIHTCGMNWRKERKARKID